jgi:peroxiredoxin
MRVRFLLALLAVLTASACAQPGDAAGRAAPAPSTTPPATAAPATAAPAAARRPPPGLAPAGSRPAAPALEVTSFDGRRLTVAGFRGRPLVVSFFESWCPICQSEQPDLTAVAGQFAGRAGFVGVSNHDTVAAGRAYQRRFHVPYPLANDDSGRTWAAWSVPYQPVVVLLDAEGRVAQRYEGGTTAGTLRAALDYLTGE